jgi:hypothetical protein
METNTIITQEYIKNLTYRQLLIEGKADTTRCYYNDGTNKFASLLVHFTYLASGVCIDAFVDEQTNTVITVAQMTALEGSLDRFYFMANEKMKAKLP